MSRTDCHPHDRGYKPTSDDYDDYSKEHLLRCLVHQEDLGRLWQGGQKEGKRRETHVSQTLRGALIVNLGNQDTTMQYVIGSMNHILDQEVKVFIVLCSFFEGVAVLLS